MLRDEGYRVVLVNSNPATIMTDPEFADATYVEPLDVAERSRASSSGSAPTRCSRRSAARPRSTSRSSCTRRACSTQYGVELIGASVEAIHTAEDRQRVQGGDEEIGLAVPRVGLRVHARRSDARSASEVGYPLIVRPVVHPRRRRHRHRRRRRRAARASPRTASPRARSRRSSSSSRSRAGRSTSSR